MNFNSLGMTMNPNSHLVMFIPTVTKFFKYFQHQGPRKLSNQHDDWTSSDSDKAQLFNNYFYFIFSTVLLMANQQLNQNINPVLLLEVHLTNSVLLTTSKGVIIDNFSPMICKYCAISFISQLHTPRLANSLCDAVFILGFFLWNQECRG